jgi:hypothetical protein
MQNTGRFSAGLLQIRRPVGRRGHNATRVTSHCAHSDLWRSRQANNLIHAEISFRYRHSKSWAVTVKLASYVTCLQTKTPSLYSSIKYLIRGVTSCAGMPRDGVIHWNKCSCTIRMWKGRKLLQHKYKTLLFQIKANHKIAVNLSKRGHYWTHTRTNERMKERNECSLKRNAMKLVLDLNIPLKIL